MKKILFGLLIGSVCLACACSDDDDKPKNTRTSFDCDGRVCTCEGTGESECFPMGKFIVVCKDSEVVEMKACGDAE